MTHHLNKDAIKAAEAHAREVFPQESCGVIVDGRYIRCKNIADDPTLDFVMDPAEYKAALMKGKVEAVVHSHPNGPFFPSQADMQGQLDTDVPWAIIVLDDERIASEPTVWGGDTPIPPVIGRQFLHGVTDCYSLIRDFFRLGKDELAKQGIPDWPFDPIDMEDYARADEWWAGEDDLYVTQPPKWGFVEIKQHEIRAGDVFFVKIREERFKKFNHAGVYLGNNLIAHHLPGRLSRREPASLWGRQAGKWMRYVGKSDAA